MKKLEELSDIQLIKEILNCDRNIQKLLHESVDHQPGAIMALGDFYVEKTLLIDELLRRRTF